MAYSSHPVVRPIAGRLSLDFVNTANWSGDGQVIDEKIRNLAHLDAWLNGLGLSDAVRPQAIDEVYELRAKLRIAFLGKSGALAPGLYPSFDSAESHRTADLGRQSVCNLVKVSALSILSDRRELARLKMCPGHNCGWLFIDETKNARRKWCIMEVCGNRAKAARNYAKKIGT